jgi:hypothetical protein
LFGLGHQISFNWVNRSPLIAKEDSHLCCAGRESRSERDWFITRRSERKHLDTAWSRRFSGPPEGDRGHSGEKLPTALSLTLFGSNVAPGLWITSRVYLLMTLTLMGDWYSEGCNRNSKETSAKLEMLGTRYCGDKRENKFLAQDKFSLLTGAF